MTYHKFEFAKALSQQLDSGFDELEFSVWAYQLYLDHANHLEPDPYEEMMRVVALEEGKQFHLSDSELRGEIRKLTAKKYHKQRSPLCSL